MSEHDTAQLRLAGIKDGSFIQVEHSGALKGGSSSYTKVHNKKDSVDVSLLNKKMIQDSSILGEVFGKKNLEESQNALTARKPNVSEAEAEILAQNF